MATDYNANLIAELYATEDAEKATHICDEMVEIGDAIFPKQIHEAYKKFQGTTIYSHYFVSDLTSFKSRDVAEILKEIARTTKRDADISMMIDYLTDIEYFEPEIVDKVVEIFKEDLISGKASEYDIEKYFTYLEKSGKGIESLEPHLKMCFENDEQTISVRRTALKKLLKLKPKEYINFYYENYDSIKGKKIEIIFVEEISNWNGGIIPSLHRKISGSGSERAQEILREKQSKKIKERQSEAKRGQEKIKEEYVTADVISDIAKLRYKVNKISITDKRFGFPIFPPSEEIYQQGKPARDKETLVGYCMVFRSLIQSFDNKIKELEMPEERAKELLPEIKELKGGINKFHLLLLDKGLNVDPGIFGLRNINRIVSKLAHPDEGSSPELTKLLEEEKLLDLYKEDHWSILHREILLRYKGVLEKLINAFLRNNKIVKNSPEGLDQPRF